jgi:hypothetical protein
MAGFFYDHDDALSAIKHGRIVARCVFPVYNNSSHARNSCVFVRVSLRGYTRAGLVPRLLRAHAEFCRL